MFLDFWKEIITDNPTNLDNWILCNQVKEKLKNRPAVEFPSNCEWFNTSQPWTSDHLKGRLTLLDFWTYCCVNCMHILPDLEAIEEEFENNEKLLIIGVHRFFHYPNFLVYISLLAEWHWYFVSNFYCLRN